MTFEDFHKYFNENVDKVEKDDLFLYKAFYDKWSESGCMNMYAGFPENMQAEIFMGFAISCFEEIYPVQEDVDKNSIKEIPDSFFLKLLANHDYATIQRLLDNTYRVPEKDYGPFYCMTLAYSLLTDAGIKDRLDKEKLSHSDKNEVLTYLAYIFPFKTNDSGENRISIFCMVNKRHEFLNFVDSNWRHLIQEALA